MWEFTYKYDIALVDQKYQLAYETFIWRATFPTNKLEGVFVPRYIPTKFYRALRILYVRAVTGLGIKIISTLVKPSFNELRFPWAISADILSQGTLYYVWLRFENNSIRKSGNGIVSTDE